MNGLIQLESKNNIIVISAKVLAKEIGKSISDVNKRIGDIILDLKKSNPDTAHNYFIKDTFIGGNNRQYDEWFLTKDGFTLYMFNIQGYNDFKMAYINKFNEMEQQLKSNAVAITEEQKLVLSIYAGGVEAVEATKALVELKTKELQQAIEYKEDVIIALTDDIELKDKRQILNQVVRYKGADFRERWKKLYYEFEKKYHINLDARVKNYNSNNKPKLSKLDYIEKVMNKLPQLYEIASKLYEGDVNKIIEEYKELVE